MSTPYDDKYRREDYYWSKRPSSICYEVLKRMTPERPLKLLDIGCGEGRNAVFFCTSSGVPHQHAVNRIIARKLST